MPEFIPQMRAQGENNIQDIHELQSSGVNLKTSPSLTAPNLTAHESQAGRLEKFLSLIIPQPIKQIYYDLSNFIMPIIDDLQSKFSKPETADIYNRTNTEMITKFKESSLYDVSSAQQDNPKLPASEIEQSQANQEARPAAPQKPLPAVPQKPLPPIPKKSTPEVQVVSNAANSPQSTSAVSNATQQLIDEKAESLFQEMKNLKAVLLQNPDEMTFATFEQLKQMSKTAKELQKQVGSVDLPTSQKLNEVRESYKTIIQAHQLAREFKEIKAEAKVWNNWNNNPNKSWSEQPTRNKLTRFESFLVKSNSGAIEALERREGRTEDATNAVTNKETWNSIRKRMWDAHVETKPFAAQKKQITWLSGSKSSSIPGIMRAAQTELAKNQKPALVPTGMLMKHNIIPMAGEMGRGTHPLAGVNREQLSGVKVEDMDVAIAYASDSGYQFNAEKELEAIQEFTEMPFNYALENITRARVAVLRLCLMGIPIPLDLINQINLAKMKLLPSNDWKNYPQLIGQKVNVEELENAMKGDSFNRGQVVAIRQPQLAPPAFMFAPDSYELNPQGDLVYAVVHNDDPYHPDEIQLVYPNLKNPDSAPIKLWVKKDEIIPVDPKALEAEAAKSPLTSIALPRVVEEFAVIDKYIEDMLTLPREPEALQKFSEVEKREIENPYPIVWASTTLKPNPIGRKEYVVKGAAEIGRDRDIQYVFTHKDNVEALRNTLQEHQVEVLSFDAGLLIAARQPREWESYQFGR